MFIKLKSVQTNLKHYLSKGSFFFFFLMCTLALIQWGPIVNSGSKHPLFPRKTQPTSRNGKQQGRWEGTSNKLKGPVCIQQTHTHKHKQQSKWIRWWSSHTQGKCFGRYHYCIDMPEKKGRGGGLELNRPHGGSDIFISLSRLPFPLKQPDWLVCLCYYGGGKEDSTLFFPWPECLSHTQDLSQSVVSLGTDPWMLRDFHWCWWRLLWYISPHVGPPPCPVITRLWVLQPVPATTLVYVLLPNFLCFPFWFLWDFLSRPSTVRSEFRGLQ